MFFTVASMPDPHGIRELYKEEVQSPIDSYNNPLTSDLCFLGNRHIL